MNPASIPTLEHTSGLSRYFMAIRCFPLLESSEEYMLAKRWRSHEDLKAAHRLITSHLRLVAKIAMNYRGYGLPINEVVSEGNVGLMQAVKRFDPDRGFRLSTYAIWWIRSAIHEYILRSWSLVKLGTTSSQKKLFFNLRKIKGQISAFDEGDLCPDQVKQIADRLGVKKDDVISMNRRIAGDKSLNSPIGYAKNNEGNSEWQDLLADESMSQEQKLVENEELLHRRAALSVALASLKERERRIFEARRLTEPSLTLEELSKEFKVSKERIRQIEVRTLKKIQTTIAQQEKADIN
ncbi:MAG: RNA polymerase sigma factor RpoH [Alphaproteobacteria bacterium]|nr:RNA polymerase sigma factor RpoH [Alphaproteobacteria bacterium]